MHHSLATNKHDDDDDDDGVHSFPAHAQHKGTAWRTSRQFYLLCRWERHLAGFPHLGLIDRWPVTPKRARYSALIAFS